MFLKTCHCPASVAVAFSFVNPIFLGLFGTFYVNESKLIVVRNKQMLFFLAPISEFNFLNFISVVKKDYSIH